MKIAVLTSSRADYGIYLPLLKRLKKDKYFSLKIIAFGTHLSTFHGYTLKQIEAGGFNIYAKVESLITGDSPEAIASSIGLTTIKFSSLWNEEQHDLDLIICLGDRYEMFAAVSASIPFNIPVAHIHGGETTLGAIDNKFRHALTLMSDYHFTSTDSYASKVKQLVGHGNNVYNVSALSLDNLNEMKLLNMEQFKRKYAIDLSIPTALVTFHPETISFEKNEYYANELISALEKLEHQLIITMPNADTMGNHIRMKLREFVSKRKNTFAVESFGTLGYFSSMKHCAFVLGNSSSGIIEAASFAKYAINIGDRQKGRECGKNVIHCPIKSNEILKAVKQINHSPKLNNKNIYGNGNAAEKIIKVLRGIKK